MNTIRHTFSTINLARIVRRHGPDFIGAFFVGMFWLLVVLVGALAVAK